MAKTKLASSGSEEGLKECITKFYCSNDPDNYELYDSGHVVRKADSKVLSTTWSKSGKRFIFWMD